MREIKWTRAAEESLNRILKHLQEHSTPGNAGQVYDSIMAQSDGLLSEWLTPQPCRELVDIGIDDVFELQITPWKIYYKILNGNKLALIQWVLDSRRHIEEVLIEFVLENKT
jgi:plasmid stabilization system protein ParE